MRIRWRREGSSRDEIEAIVPGPSGLQSPISPPAQTTVAERALLTGVLAGTLLTVLFVAASGVVPFQQPLSFALVFWANYLVIAVATSLLLFFALAVVARPAGLERAATRVAGGLAVVVALLAMSSDKGVVRALFALEGPARHRWLCPISFVFACCGLLTLLHRFERMARARWLTAASVAAALGAFFPGAQPTTTTAVETAAASPKPTPNLLLLGVDGASWTFVDALLARGELPHFAALKKRGAWGALKSFEPTRSPAIWTTIATGKPPREHGILGFMDERIRGARQPLPALHGPAWLGFDQLHEFLKSTGQVFESPVTSTSRRVPAYWNIASLHRSPVAVVNWWATWPAEEIHGSVISELPFNRPRERGPSRALTFPEGLSREIASEVVSRERVPLERLRRFADLSPADYDKMQGSFAELKGVEWLTHFVALFDTTRRLGLFSLERGRRQYGVAPDLLLLFGLVDATSHIGLRYSDLVREHLGVAPADVAKFGPMVGEAYREVDRALGDLMDAAGESNVIVISDHGFELQADAVPLYGHDRAPDGIFLAAGPAFRPGAVAGLSVYDILPLLLYLKGFPVANDLPGRVPLQAFEPAFVSRKPLLRIASYGSRQPPDAGVSALVDEETRQRLRALGYIN